ncbi:glycosyltransferase family 4 protein [Candidatus Odyssella thessalonicensis]|uniref:glycosyltransferase family 4 protein n=1 Tax=Candidatus Odyssella thessalonicensis TaxID=84647 RepID=UPI000225B90F|nr:glycosyltransferase family 4 protein [Candidatus Odyssella thessalonicensis]
MKKPIVLQVLPRLNSGGVERVTVDTAGFLSRVDPKPTYVASEGGILLADLEERGVHHIKLSLATKNPLKIIWNAFWLLHFIKKHHIELIHARSRAPAWSSLIAAYLADIPFIATYHGAYRCSNSLKRWYNSVMVRGKCVISISNFVTAHIEENHHHLKPKIVKIYPGIDTKEIFNPERYTASDILAQRQKWSIPADAFVMAAVGRIAKAKRFDLAVQALGALAENKKLFLIIAGSDQGRTELSANLKELAYSLGVADRFRLIHDFKDIPLIYALSDLILFPTALKETFGRISAEAGAMGKIIISTQQGASAELIINGVTGYLIPADNLGALVECIQTVLKLASDQRVAMEKNAHHYILENFSAERMYNETLNLYNSLLSLQEK